MSDAEQKAPSPALVILAKNLGKLRDEHATLTSQAAIGKKAGIDQRTVGRILNMEHEPTLSQLSKLAEAFNLDQPWKILVPDLVPSNPPMLASDSAGILKLLENIGSTKEAIEGYLRHEGNTDPGDLIP